MAEKVFHSERRKLSEGNEMEIRESKRSEARFRHISPGFGKPRIGETNLAIIGKVNALRISGTLDFEPSRGEDSGFVSRTGIGIIL